MAYDVMMTNAVSSSLQTLLFSNDELQTAQLQASSGLRVASAKDNSNYWSIATSLRSDMSIMNSIGDALNLSESTVDTAYTNAESVYDQLSELRATLVNAFEEGVDRNQISTTVEGYKSSIKLAVSSASFGGANWLTNDNADLSGTNSIVSGFQRSSNGNVALTTQGIAQADTVLIDTYDANRGLLTGPIDANLVNSDGTSTPRNYYLLDAGSATAASGTEIAISDATTEQELEDMISVVDQLMTSMNKLSARLGDMVNRVSSNRDYVTAVAESLDKSIGRFVDVDMEEAAVRLTAAKTQQTLAAENVAMANSNAQTLRTLFG